MFRDIKDQRQMESSEHGKEKSRKLCGSGKIVCVTRDKWCFGKKKKKVYDKSQDETRVGTKVRVTVHRVRTLGNLKSSV